MKQILIIGIGAGNPDHMTVQAIDALNRADMLFIPVKGDDKRMLVDIRRDICQRFVTGKAKPEIEFIVPDRAGKDAAAAYRMAVGDWHGQLAEIYENLLTSHVADGQSAAILVWGDPGLYDSTIRVVERIVARGNVAIEYDVIPGITSIQALAARHRIPLNDIGGPVRITTGRRLGDDLGGDGETTIVMLDSRNAFANIDPEMEIFWGAYVGTDAEIMIAGKLGDVADEITRVRAEARIRHGWIMDSYLLRKQGRDDDDI
ncbi:precorrin-6A synthase (deacetylating) [Thalassospira sp.]|uniref:precorrin-6A synthase (deacetylating) n=1 Tax=Thalassospira sp. TaxID=1912094 RepID=UPI002733F341|nr:precorrin-6A synthase (deacetylating) [Thalassospira sp.]MDP2700007.1 precorrin-6A synthase (deacetylating) [Thalassospira sp.]